MSHASGSEVIVEGVDDVPPRDDGPPRESGQRTWHWQIGRGTLTDRRAFIVLLILHLLVAIPAIAGGHLLPVDRESTSDVPIFNDRAAALLRGDIGFESTEKTTVTPPLVNLLFVPALLAGGSLVAYAVLFSLFTLATAWVLWKGLSALGPIRALLVASLFVANPFAWVTYAIMVQDDTIAPLFVAIAFLALLHGRHHLSAATSGLGVMVKAFPGLGAPFAFFAAQTWRSRATVLAAGVLPVLVVALPVLLARPDAFVPMLRFYGFGDAPDGGSFEGLSLWRFLVLAGFDVRTGALYALFAVANVLLWILVALRRLDPVKGFALAFVLIFLLYPKLHLGYYILLLLVALPWAIHDGTRMTSLALASVVAVLAHLFWMERLPVHGAWVWVPILLAAYLIVFAARWTLRIGVFSPSLRDEWTDDDGAHPAARLMMGWDRGKNLLVGVVLVALQVTAAWTFLAMAGLSRLL